MHQKNPISLIFKNMPISRMLVCIILLALCFATVFVSIIAWCYNPIQKETESTNLTDNQIITYVRTPQYFNAITDNVPQMTHVQYENIVNKLPEKSFCAIYSFNGGLSIDIRVKDAIPKEATYYSKKIYGVSAINIDMMQAFNFKVLNGHIPKKYNEIALPLYLAEKLAKYGVDDVSKKETKYYANPLDLVGTYVTLGNDIVHIVGVIDTGVNLRKYDSLKNGVANTENLEDLSKEIVEIKESINNSIFVTEDYIEYYFYQNAQYSTNYPNNIIIAVYTVCNDDVIDRELVELSYDTSLDKNYRFKRVGFLHSNIHNEYVVSMEIAIISLMIAIVVGIISFAYVRHQFVKSIALSISHYNKTRVGLKHTYLASLTIAGISLLVALIVGVSAISIWNFHTIVKLNINLISVLLTILASVLYIHLIIITLINQHKGEGR